MVHSAEILKAENIALRKANEVANQRRRRKNKQIRRAGSMLIQEG